MTDIKSPPGYELWPEDQPVAAVLTFQVLRHQEYQEYAEIPQTVMWTCFEGKGAGRRAENFMANERERDFIEADGWHWMIWMNQPAREELAELRTRELLGENT